MKPSASWLSLALLLGSWAAAQSDPFQRGAPAQTVPTLRNSAVGVAPSGAAVSPTAVSQASTFGNPRTSSDGRTTRVVFDLPSGTNYSLTPTFGGLRIDVQGARVLPSLMAKLGPSVTEYRAGGGQVTLVTPFPLSPKDGWRASEATIAGGTKVLILEFGATLSGGAGASIKGKTLASPPASTQAAQAVLNTPLASNESTPQNLPPGDTIRTGPVLPPAAAIPGADPEKPSPMSGRVTGNSASSTVLVAPRIGKYAGYTRTVLDLPPGTTYRIVPGALGLRVELSNVNMGNIIPSMQNVSPEVREWRYTPTANGVSVNFLTGTPTSEHGGWRSLLLPPTAGDTRSRLVIDFSPAFADTTPLTSSEKRLAAVPAMATNRGTAILALAASYAQPRVVIDPGHGGIDPGAIGTIREKDVTLAVGLRVRDLLRAAGVNVVMTRETDTQLSLDKNTDLKMRAAMGTPGTQMFVSIHVNAIDPRNVLRGYGVETWFTNNHPLSGSLANLLQTEMVKSTSAASKGLKRESFAVLRESRIPAALVEIGYTSHPVDGVNLKDENYLDRVAVGIANGIRNALMTGVSASGQPLAGATGVVTADK